MTLLIFYTSNGSVVEHGDAAARAAAASPRAPSALSFLYLYFITNKKTFI